MANSVVIGIDLGTTNSCAAVFENGRITVIQNENGSATTPSYVAFPSSKGIVHADAALNKYSAVLDEERTVGAQAKNNAYLDPQNTLFAIKRIIGRRFNDEEVKIGMSRWPFKLVNVDGFPALEITENGVRKNVTPEEVSAEILKSLKQLAEDKCGVPVTKAVITVPANFGDAQRKATVAAGKMVGLDVILIINEPTAAAIAYGLQNRESGSEKKTILVFDFGGGTLDVSIITATERTSFEVLSTAGDMHFGGEDFDQRILQHLIEEFEKTNGKGLQESSRALSLLRNAAELAKRILSGKQQTIVAVNSLHNGTNFKSTLTKAKFEELCADLFLKILGPVEEALTGAKLSKSDIGQVVLVGGSSRIPKVINILQDYFTKQKVFKDINPDEAIAMGAAAFAGVLTGGSVGIKIADIIPKALGVEVYDGSLSIILPRYSRIPSKLTGHDYTTVNDNQTSVSINVYEGQAKIAKDKDNKFWGSAMLHGIQPAPAKTPKLYITFAYDSSGILNVDAGETGTATNVQFVIATK